jgi:muramoyltetrapeptide carboxypeptidase
MNTAVLKEGDVIGIVAPSCPIIGTDLEENYKRGLVEINKMGFKYNEGKTINLKKWHLAGSDEERAADINTMFLDKTIKAIICAVGGTGADRILDKLDYETIQNNPKPFMGISDPTTLTSALFQLSNTPTIYGPDVCFGFGGVKSDEQKKWEFSMIKHILTSEKPLGTIKHLTEWNRIKGGYGKGYLIGGHLGLYNRLKGTKYFADIKNKPKIFFWETTGKYSNVDRDLQNLIQYGFFENVVGMIIGKFNLMDKEDEYSDMPPIEKIISEKFIKYTFPIISGADFGHNTPNIPMPYGKLASIDGDKIEFQILESIYQIAR